MREEFWLELEKLMEEHDDIVVLTADTGFKVMDRIIEKYGGERCLNVGIAEQLMIGMAAGLAMSGKVVYCYAIDPFVLNRPYEFVRVDLCVEKLKVRLIGVGAGLDYSTLGSTHHSESRFAAARSLPNLTIYSPSDKAMTRKLTRESYDIDGPVYMSLSRYGEEELCGRHSHSGYHRVITCNEPVGYADVIIFSTGKMVETAIQVVDICAERYGITPILIDLYQLKPIDFTYWQDMNNRFTIVTIEEHSIIGGIGELVASELGRPVLKIGLPDEFVRHYDTSREALLASLNLDAESIAKRIKEELL